MVGFYPAIALCLILAAVMLGKVISARPDGRYRWAWYDGGTMMSGKETGLVGPSLVSGTLFAVAIGGLLWVQGIV